MEKILKGKIIAVDFDGVISEYEGWKGVGIFGKPVVGVQWSLNKFREMGAEVVIHTCRRETDLVVSYLKENNIPYDYINFSPRNTELKLSHMKIGADIYIDDRALTFTGEWKETYRQVVNFRRWGKKLGSISSKSI